MLVTGSPVSTIARPRFGNTTPVEDEIRQLLPWNHDDLRYIGERLQAIDPTQGMSGDTIKEKIVDWTKANGKQDDLLTVLKTTKAINGAFINTDQITMALYMSSLEDLSQSQIPDSCTKTRASLAIAFELATKPETKPAITKALQQENPTNSAMNAALKTFNASLPLFEDNSF